MDHDGDLLLAPSRFTWSQRSGEELNLTGGAVELHMLTRGHWARISQVASGLVQLQGHAWSQAMHLKPPENDGVRRGGRRVEPFVAGHHGLGSPQSTSRWNRWLLVSVGLATQS